TPGLRRPGLLGTRPAVVAADAHPRWFGDRWTSLVPLPGVDRSADHQVDGRLELTTQCRPHVGESPILRRWQGDGDRDGYAELGEGPSDQVLGQRVEAQERGEQGGQQPVLVLRSLSPRGD